MLRIAIKLLLLFVLTPICGFGATKHALIIAIGDYPAAGGWPKLSSRRDAEFIKKTLLNEAFEDKNIRMVTEMRQP